VNSPPSIIGILGRGRFDYVTVGIFSLHTLLSFKLVHNLFLRGSIHAPYHEYSKWHRKFDFVVLRFLRLLLGCITKEVTPVRDENEQKRKRRGASKGSPKEEHSMPDTMGDQRTGSDNEEESNFPDEWISIAAYYIWKNDGQPDGRDAEYWYRAKAELMQLRKDGNLPTRPDTLDEER
jgi:hypothetical protein